jgi:hypothetical protein
MRIFITSVAAGIILFETVDMSACPVLKPFYMTAFPLGELSVEPGQFLYPAYMALFMS